MYLQDEKIKSVDFGFGDAKYKRTLCNENWQEASIYIFAPTFKNAIINGFRVLISLTSRFSQNIAKRFKIEEHIKKIWPSKCGRNGRICTLPCGNMRGIGL